MVIGLAALFYLNTIYDTISNKLLLILVLFSLSIVALNVLKNFISVENNKLLSNNGDFRINYENTKRVIFFKNSTWNDFSISAAAYMDTCII